MKNTILFAVDSTTNEIIVSESQKGSNKVDLIERITKHENEILFDAVTLLTKVTAPENFDLSVFKAIDKVCQLIYSKAVEDK